MSLAIARRLAQRNPRAMLPCPLCAASVRAENLERHLEKTHRGERDEAPQEWKGKGLLLPARVWFDGDCLRLSGTLGLRRRRVGLPAIIEVGGARVTRPSPISSSYALDSLEGALLSEDTTIPVGIYMRLMGEPGRLTIRCRTSTDVRKHWIGWLPGKKRWYWHVTLDAPTFVALQYALAARGELTLRDEG